MFKTKEGQTRFEYDLSHFVFSCGNIGCLQTLATVPVVAGDSMELDFEGVFRLSPLRRPLYVDAMVDLFAFYIPYRHIWGSDWVTFMKAGKDEATTFGTYTLNGTTENHCLGTHINVSTAFPEWLGDGYANIWNYYFKHPSDSDMAGNFFTADVTSKNYYGQLCCFPKRAWNTGISYSLTSADTQVSTAGNVMELTDFAIAQGRMKSELKRDWFGQRYVDIMNELFSSNISEEVEPRPYLLMRNTCYLSGYETDGTSGDSMGMFQARSVGIGNLRFPSRFFPEHGTLWIMALVRFPPIIYWEQHYLTKPANAEPTYLQISGEPDLVANQPPQAINDGDCWYKVSTTNTLGHQAYAWWYREHPNFVHPLYLNVGGHPFLNYAPNSAGTARYYTLTLYDNIFATLQLAHWQVQGHVGLSAKRLVPDPRTSVFAGTR